MRKLIVKEWMTLDGIIDAQTMNVWQAPYHSDSRAKVIVDTIAGSGAMLYGRKTYEMLMPYWSSLKNNEMGIADKLNSVKKYIVSTTLEKADWNNSVIIKDNVVEEIRKIKQEPGEQILLDGSSTLAHSLMGTGLIDEYQFLVHPIVMGSGLSFFNDSTAFAKLELIESKTLELGVMLLRYKPIEETR